MIAELPRSNFKVGMFNYDPQTKKVKVKKDKGDLRCYTVYPLTFRTPKEKIILVGSTLNLIYKN